MAYTPKDMSGTLFPNDRATSDRHPQWKGSVLIDGNEYWVSGWDKDGGRGQFISLAFQKKEARREAQAPKPAPKSDPLDEFPQDDIPW